MSWLALDIGGANLKMADGADFAVTTSFPLWLQPDQLGQTLQDMIADAPQAESLAVTMTGELADCFATKREGVEAILDAAELAAAGRELRVYLVDGRLVAPPVARAEPWLAAASNWHVLADFARRYCPFGPGLLLDIGSTTCDLIPLGPAGPAAIGRTDPERLIAGELVYTGVQRSPVCALVAQIDWRGEPCPVAQEVFATTHDAYLLLDELAADPQNRETADGRPSTKDCALARLARTICADTTMFSMTDAQQAAAAICEAQLVMLESAVRKVGDRMPGPPVTLVLSGHGEFLGRKLVERLSWKCRVVSITEQLGPEVSRSACAHALAVLAGERART